MVSLSLSSAFPICASWQSAHFISVNGNTMAIASGNESNDRGRVIRKEGKDYIDFYGRSWR
jgi:hypothetical protein